MTDSTPVQCPTCGWTGTQSDLEQTEQGAACPACREPMRTE